MYDLYGVFVYLFDPSGKLEVRLLWASHKREGMVRALAHALEFPKALLAVSWKWTPMLGIVPDHVEWLTADEASVKAVDEQQSGDIISKILMTTVINQHADQFADLPRSAN